LGEIGGQLGKGKTVWEALGWEVPSLKFPGHFKTNWAV